MWQVKDERGSDRKGEREYRSVGAQRSEVNNLEPGTWNLEPGTWNRKRVSAIQINPGNDRPVPWVKELVWQRCKNLVKRVVVAVR